MMKKVLLSVLIISFTLVSFSAMCCAADTESIGKLAQSSGAKININAAKKVQLKTLPGITDNYAQKIIDGRPYINKEDLKTKKIIPAGVYERIKDRIVTKELS
jgi:DNA uptake protein ComE-like DNA-binding protein